MLCNLTVIGLIKVMRKIALEDPGLRSLISECSVIAFSFPCPCCLRPVLKLHWKHCSNAGIKIVSKICVDIFQTLPSFFLVHKMCCILFSGVLESQFRLLCERIIAHSVWFSLYFSTGMQFRGFYFLCVRNLQFLSLFHRY